MSEKLPEDMQVWFKKQEVNLGNKFTHWVVIGTVGPDLYWHFDDQWPARALAEEFLNCAFIKEGEDDE